MQNPVIRMFASLLTSATLLIATAAVMNVQPPAPAAAVIA